MSTPPGKGDASENKDETNKDQASSTVKDFIKESKNTAAKMDKMADAVQLLASVMVKQQQASNDKEEDYDGVYKRLKFLKLLSEQNYFCFSH